MVSNPDKLQNIASAGVQAQPEEQSYVLDVAQSVLGKKWVSVEVDDRTAQGISQAFGLPEIVGRLLVARGVDFEQVEDFLNPSIKTQLPDPSSLTDMDKAAERIADAIMKGEKVAVFGDYDVDGATSSALLKKFFTALGQDLRIWIPDRIDEGYGPNAPAMLTLKEEGMDVVITVDCGTTSFEPLDAGTKAGLDIVVVDHHRTEVQMPNAHAVVNPNRMDDDSGQGHLAAVGVVFLTIVAVNRVLRERGYYKQGKVAEPRILQWLDLVALGTVCDVVPLTGVNRAFVSQGLKVMAMRQNAGIVALADIADVNEAPNTFHAGFLLGPRVNAGGRVGEASLGATLLSTEDAAQAREIATKLNIYNNERRTLEKVVLEQAIEIVEAEQKGNWVLVVCGEGWHPGVIGIVASRLKDKYQKPTCVVAFDENGVGKASARSVNGVDLGSAVISAKQKELLVAGGGHKMAAGFTVTRDLLAEFTAYINEHIKEQLQGMEYVPELRIDSVLSPHSLTTELVEKIDMLAPYGAGHSQPRMVLTGVRIVKPKVVGENHVSFFISDSSGGASVKGIAFRALETELGDLLLTSGKALVHLAGHVSINEWMGRRNVNFQVVDAYNPWEMEK